MFGCLILSPPDGFTQTVDATGQWTYVINSRNADCSIVPPPDEGTLTISQVGNKVTVVNERYGKTYTGTVNQLNQYTVSSTYSFFGGQKTETLQFQISSDFDTFADGTSTWQWTDLSGTASCSPISGSYVFSMTKHQQPGACYVDYDVQYCCTADGTGTEHCCHVDNHPIYYPNPGTPELEHCCYIDGTDGVEYCSYVAGNMPYEYYPNVNGGTDVGYWINFLGMWLHTVSSGAPLANSGALSGSVTTSDGKDVVTTITTYNYPSGEMYKSTSTVGSGNPKSYVFGSLGATTYYIKASAPGYNLYNSTISISTGQTLTHNITLTPVNQDQCTSDPYKTSPGICGCGVPDIDSDGDGTPDCIDKCPVDPLKSAPGICGCRNSDKDSDKDGKPDCIDLCPQDPNKTDPELCGCGALETDANKNGLADCREKWMPGLNLLLYEQ